MSVINAYTLTKKSAILFIAPTSITHVKTVDQIEGIVNTLFLTDRLCVTRLDVRTVMLYCCKL